MRFGALHVITALVVVGGCDSRERESARVEIDTLPTGTVIVRNPAGVAASTPPWRLELVARMPAAGDSVVFGQVRDVAISAQGEVYVLDRQASEVLVFDTTGSLLRRFGGPGQGPGEFRGAYALAIDSAGRIWVAEEGGNRYSQFTSSGELIAAHRRPMRHSFTFGVLVVGRDGNLHELNSTLRSPAAFRISVRDSVWIRDTLALPPFEILAFRRMLGSEQLLSPVAFAPRRAMALSSAGDVWMSDGARYRLALIGRGGDTVRVIEVDRANVGLSELERAQASARADSSAAEGYDVDRSLIPDVHPALSAIALGDDGTLWVQRIGESAAGTGARTLVYDVFDSTGALVGTATAPFAPSPQPHITARHIVGVVLGGDDEPFVELYRIVRP